eukprot:scaffold934_cov69-Phaeocystis_antarctica.AAC.8
MPLRLRLRARGKMETRTLGSQFERGKAYVSDSSVELPLSALATAAPPSEPSLLDERSSTLIEPKRAHTTASTVGRLPPGSLERSCSSPSTPAARKSPLPNSGPFSLPSLTTFAQNGPHFQGGESRGSRCFPVQIARTVKYSWNERCDERICSGSASSRLSSGNRSCATLSRTTRSASLASAGNSAVVRHTNSVRAARFSCVSPKSRTSSACASKNVASSKLIRCGTAAADAAAPRSLRSTRSSIALDAVSYNSVMVAGIAEFMPCLL